VLAKRWVLVLQLDARPWRIRFTNLWIFLALRLFRWMLYCVTKCSLLLCFLNIFIFRLYLLTCCSEIVPSSCRVSTTFRTELNYCTFQMIFLLMNLSLHKKLFRLFMSLLVEIVVVVSVVVTAVVAIRQQYLQLHFQRSLMLLFCK
jgi:hypothetical protein